MVPAVEEIQAAINGGAVAVLKCSKRIDAWDTVTIPKNVQLILNPNLPPVQGTGGQGTFYDRIAADKEILKVVLLLTGSVQSTKNNCEQYLTKFKDYEWCWKDDIAKNYKKFIEGEPTLDDFEVKLKYFVGLEKEVEKWNPTHQISALMLQTTSLQKSLKELANTWKEAFAKELHKDAYANTWKAGAGFRDGQADEEAPAARGHERGHRRAGVRDEHPAGSEAKRERDRA